MPYDPITGRMTDDNGNPVDAGLPPPPPGMPQAAPAAPQPTPSMPPPFMLQRSTPDPGAQPPSLPAPPSLGAQPGLPEPARPMPGMPDRAPEMPSSMPPQFAPSSTATDAYARDVASVPKTSIWQKLGAMALGGAAGYANAGGRVHIDPNAINSATSNIMYPGRAAELARLKTSAGIEQQSNATNRQAQLDTANVGLTQARTTSELAQADLYKAQIQKALNDPNHYHVSADGTVTDMRTGVATYPNGLEAQKTKAKRDAAIAGGLKEGSWEFNNAVFGTPQPHADSRATTPHYSQTKDGTVYAHTVGDDGKISTQKVGSYGTPQASGMAGVPLSPEALNLVSNMYLKTGVMPSLGMGAQSTRTQIIEGAAKNANGADLASNVASYASDKSSLAALQRMSDAVISFKKTADKNLDLFLSTAKPVMDSGSPLITRPMRSISRNVLGAPEMAAFDVARRVAINEIAKVTSNPTLAGQLSDSARKEVESLIPEGASLEQVYRAASILKQDMANRNVSLKEQLAEIRGRISSQAGGAKGGAPATGVPEPGQQFQGETVKSVKKIR